MYLKTTIDQNCGEMRRGCPSAFWSLGQLNQGSFWRSWAVSVTEYKSPLGAVESIKRTCGGVGLHLVHWGGLARGPKMQKFFAYFFSKKVRPAAGDTAIGIGPLLKRYWWYYKR